MCTETNTEQGNRKQSTLYRDTMLFSVRKARLAVLMEQFRRVLSYLSTFNQGIRCNFILVAISVVTQKRLQTNHVGLLIFAHDEHCVQT